MAGIFTVYNITKHSSEVMDYQTVCSNYPDVNLSLLKEENILIISIYSGGEKVAVINRVKEVVH